MWLFNFYPALYRAGTESIYTCISLHEIIGYLWFYVYQCLLALAEKPGDVLHLAGSHAVLGGPTELCILTVKLQDTNRANPGNGCQWLRLRACNTYCRSGPCVPTHTAVRQWPSSFTCIILSCYITPLYWMELLWVYSNERKGLNPCDSEIKYSALSGQFTTCCIPFLRMGWKGMWRMFLS